MREVIGRATRTGRGHRSCLPGATLSGLW